jgi:hypothetical protein
MKTISELKMDVDNWSKKVDAYKFVCVNDGAIHARDTFEMPDIEINGTEFDYDASLVYKHFAKNNKIILICYECLDRIAPDSNGYVSFPSLDIYIKCNIAENGEFKATIVKVDLS